MGAIAPRNAIAARRADRDRDAAESCQQGVARCGSGAAARST